MIGYFVSRAGWQKLVTSLIAFILSRFVIEQITRRPVKEVDEAADGGEP